MIGDIVTEKSQSYSQNLQAEKIQNYYKWSIEVHYFEEFIFGDYFRGVINN